MTLRLADMPGYFGHHTGRTILRPHGMMPMRRHDERYTYIVQAQGSGHLKIGTTRDVRSRLPVLQNAASDELRIVAILDGQIYTEGGLHRRFRQQRIRGEWYRPAKRLLTAVAQMEGAQP